MDIDQVRLRFDGEALLALNVVLGLMMFGIALDLRAADFRRVAKMPRAALVGLAGQFLLFPATTFLIVKALEPPPSIGLGMILVAACPGGNVSNFLTHLARGNTALSISMSAVSTVAAVVMTPLNLALWGSLDPRTSALLREVSVDLAPMATAIVLVLGLPLALGRLTHVWLPALADRLRRPVRALSIVSLGGFIAAALAANLDAFVLLVGRIAWLVILQNGAALALGYAAARALRLGPRDARAISIECGIQNSGLGLALILRFFDGLGGMAAIAAFWGMWHIVSGLAVASVWARRPPAEEGAGPGAGAPALALAEEVVA